MITIILSGICVMLFAWGMCSRMAYHSGMNDWQMAKELLSRKIDEMQSSLREITEKYVIANGKISRQKNELAKAEQALKQKESDLAASQKHVNNKIERIASLMVALDEKNDEIAQLNKSKTELHKSLRKKLLWRAPDYSKLKYIRWCCAKCGRLIVKNDIRWADNKPYCAKHYPEAEANE